MSMFGYGRNVHNNTAPVEDKNPEGGRAKHVLDTSSIAHAWAHPLESDGSGYYQTHARNPQFNLFYKTSDDGTRTLYSYRDSYEIGSLFQVKKGKTMRKVYLTFGGNPYSHTTAQHMHQCASAVPGSAIHWSVLCTNSDHSQAPSEREHIKNVVWLASKYAETLAKLAKVKGADRIGYLLKTATAQRQDTLDYAKFFGVKAPKLAPVPTISAERMAKAQAFDASSAERSQRIREARQARWEAQRLEYERRNKEEAENRKLTLPERIAKWRSGEYVSFYADRLDYALLRLKGSEVETSQGVKVPVSGQAGAARLFRFLKAIKDAGREYVRNGHSEHIGNFVVDSFKPSDATDPLTGPQGEWIMVAGCHRLLWSEIEAIAPAVLSAEMRAQRELDDKTGATPASERVI